MRQAVLWIGEWEQRDFGPKAKPVPLDKEPTTVWTLYRHTDPDKPPRLPLTPVHHNGAFLEDHIHDWDWRGGWFYYGSRVADRPVWLLLEYEDKPARTTKTSTSRRRTSKPTSKSASKPSRKPSRSK